MLRSERKNLNGPQWVEVFRPPFVDARTSRFVSAHKVAETLGVLTGLGRLSMSSGLSYAIPIWDLGFHLPVLVNRQGELQISGAKGQYARLMHLRPQSSSVSDCCD